MTSEENRILALLDLSEVFDTIDQNILLNWLMGLGMGDIVLGWFSSFLLDWLQLMLGKSSTAMAPALRAAIGLCCLLLLFTVYIKPLGELYGMG